MGQLGSEHNEEGNLHEERTHMDWLLSEKDATVDLGQRYEHLEKKPIKD